MIGAVAMLLISTRLKALCGTAIVMWVGLLLPTHQAHNLLLSSLDIKKLNKKYKSLQIKFSLPDNIVSDHNSCSMPSTNAVRLPDQVGLYGEKGHASLCPGRTVYIW